MSTVTAAVSLPTSAGNSVLSFAFVPLSLVAGMTIANTTNPGSLPANATILSINRVTQQVTTNLAVTGSGVSGNDSLTFTATDTLDSQTIYNAATSPQFQLRVQTLWLVKAALLMAGTPTPAESNLCAALFSNRISTTTLAQIVLANATNRANCLLDATTPGGQITDAGITTAINTDFDFVANSRNWST